MTKKNSTPNCDNSKLFERRGRKTMGLKNDSFYGSQVAGNWDCNPSPFLGMFFCGNEAAGKTLAGGA
jgi:hypothetical protein